MYLFSLLVGVFCVISAVHTTTNESVSNANNSTKSTSTSIIEKLATNVSNRNVLPNILNKPESSFFKLNTATEQNNIKANKIVKNKHSQFRWNSVVSGDKNSLSYMLNCTPTHMIIEVNLTGVKQPFVYLEKLKTFSICRPKIVKDIARFELSLDDDFYRCGTIKVYDQSSGAHIYYNRVIVESTAIESKSAYLKCSMPNIPRLIEQSIGRDKRETRRPNENSPSELGRLVNFTEIELPDNFMEAEILDFGEPITQRAPYPHLNIKVKRNGQLVNTSLNVAPGTPLEMVIYLDDKSKHVYGLLGSFMKVTDNGPRQKEEVIVLNGCSVDPYIFDNFETEDNGDSISAKFRAFKFPGSNYVMFAGTVNVCLDKCKPVSCGNDILAFGRRRRSIAKDLPKDPNKMFEIEMVTYLQVSYSPSQLDEKKDSLQGFHESEDQNKTQFTAITEKKQSPVASKLVKTMENFQDEARQLSSGFQTNKAFELKYFVFIATFSAFFSQIL